MLTLGGRRQEMGGTGEATQLRRDHCQGLSLYAVCDLKVLILTQKNE